MKPPEIEMRLDGLRELKHFFEELPLRIIEKGLKQAANAGATPVLSAYRSNITVRSGLLKKAAKKKVKLYRDKEIAVALVGVDKNVRGEFKGRKVRPANYQHLIELGVRPHSIAKGAERASIKRGNVIRATVGHVKNRLSGAAAAENPGFAGRHYLKRAEESAADAALEATTNKLRDVLEAEAEKLANK
jgi:hypothetical protein